MRSCLTPLGVLMLLGCAGDERAHIEKAVPVSGVLSYQGKPLDQYQVTFIPSDGRRPATGITDAAGKFTMGTNKPGDGAPPGKCTVTVAWVGPQSDDTASQVPIEDPTQMPQPKVKIPAKYSDPTTSGLTQEVPDGGVTDLKIDLQ